MDECSPADILLFDGFRFDRRRGGCLYRRDEAGVAEPVPLCGRRLDLLRLLLERHGELVPKGEMIRVVWRERVVEEANLNVQIAKLRHILDQNREHGSCIQTITGHGYRFVAPVTTEAGAAVKPPPDVGPPSPPQVVIIVLPFPGLGENLVQQNFTGRITEGLTIDLSPIGEMLLRSRAATAADQNKPRHAEGAECAHDHRPTVSPASTSAHWPGIKLLKTARRRLEHLLSPREGISDR